MMKELWNLEVLAFPVWIVCNGEVFQLRIRCEVGAVGSNVYNVMLTRISVSRPQISRPLNFQLFNVMANGSTVKAKTKTKVKDSIFKAKGLQMCA